MRPKPEIVSGSPHSSLPTHPDWAHLEGAVLTHSGPSSARSGNEWWLDDYERTNAGANEPPPQPLLTSQAAAPPPSLLPPIFSQSPRLFTLLAPCLRATSVCTCLKGAVEAVGPPRFSGESSSLSLGTVLPSVYSLGWKKGEETGICSIM